MSTIWQFIPSNGQESAEDYDLLLCMFLSTLVFVRPTSVQLGMKGAVERILDRCTYIGIGESRKVITHEERDNLARHANALSEEGLRVLGFAGTRFRYSMKDTIKTADRADVEKDCGFLGLVGI